MKLKIVRAIYGAEAGEFLPDKGRDKGNEMYTVGNTLLEYGVSRSLVRDMERVRVTDKCRKLIYDFFGNKRLTAGKVAFLYKRLRYEIVISHRRGPTLYR